MRNSGRPSHCGTCRRRTPRSPCPAPAPLPVITKTSRAPRELAARRNRNKAAWASLCVRPCRSRRPSIASLPRTTRCFMRRPSGASGKGALSANESGTGAGFATRGLGRAELLVASSESSVLSDSLSGATDLVTAVHSTRSSFERTRRPLPSPEPMTSGTWLGQRGRYACRCFGGGPSGCSHSHCRSGFWKRDSRGGRNRRSLDGHASRGKHHELSVLLDAAGNMADLFAMTEIDVGARWPDDRRAGVLGKQQMAEFGRRFFTFDRQLGVDPNWRAIDVDALVHRQRAPGCELHALRANAFIMRVQGRLLEEDK